MARKRVTNIEPYDLDVTAHADGSFTLEFRADVKVVRLKLVDWWLPIVVRELRLVAVKRANDAKKLLDCFKADGP